MLLTYNQIKEHDNPYELFKTENTLLENRNLLNEILSEEEKRNLASRIILGCPDTLFNQYNWTITQLSNTNNNEDFYYALKQAWDIKYNILQLASRTNLLPHLFFFKGKLNDYHQFEELYDELLGTHRVAILLNLSEKTPQEDRLQVILNAKEMFPSCSIHKYIGIAFSFPERIASVAKEILHKSSTAILTHPNQAANINIFFNSSLNKRPLNEDDNENPLKIIKHF
jgi:hypothetical protein